MASSDQGLVEVLRQVEQSQRFQDLVQRLADKCWDVCVDKPSSRLGSGTETCLTNCVGRFLDTSNFVATHLEKTVMERSGLESSFD